MAGMTLVYLMFGDERSASRRFDWVGFLLTGTALGLLMYGLELVAHGQGDRGIGIAAIGIAIGAMAVRHALRHPSPLLGLSLLQLRTFSISFLTAGAPFRLTIGASGFVFPTMF